MAHSLEARVPFLDPLVTNLAFALPTRHKVRGLAKKVAAAQGDGAAAAAEVVHGRKRGFSIPAAAWLRGELAPFARETLSPETLQRQGFFQPRAGDAAARRARRRPRGLEPPAVGPARIHALVRAPRGAGTAAARVGADGGAGGDEGLDRHDSAGARARLPAADRDHARARRRGGDHRARLRADARAARAARPRGRRGRRAPRRPVARAEGAPDDAPARRAAQLGEGPRLRRRARARLARADDLRAATRNPELDDLRLRVRHAATPARLPRRDAGRRAGRDPARAARGRTASARRSSSSTRA